MDMNTSNDVIYWEIFVNYFTQKNQYPGTKWPAKIISPIILSAHWKVWMST